jgi:hypothetical protein
MLQLCNIKHLKRAHHEDGNAVLNGGLAPRSLLRLCRSSPLPGGGRPVLARRPGQAGAAAQRGLQHGLREDGALLLRQQGHPWQSALGYLNNRLNFMKKFEIVYYNP